MGFLTLIIVKQTNLFCCGLCVGHTNVHALCFSEGAAPCPFLKSKKCALPFFRSQNCALSFFRSQNCALPFFRSQKCTVPSSEVKNKPCPFPPISRARKPDSYWKSRNAIWKICGRKIPAFKNSKFCAKTPFCF